MFHYHNTSKEIDSSESPFGLSQNYQKKTIKVFCLDYFVVEASDSVGSGSVGSGF